jgi:hypothetical protein
MSDDTTEINVQDRASIWVPVEVYVMVPPGENPFEVGWELMQGQTIVKRVKFGSYSMPNIYSELVHVKLDDTFTFFMDMKNKQYGRGESNKHVVVVIEPNASPFHKCSLVCNHSLDFVVHFLVRYEIFAWLNGKWRYLGGDRNDRRGQVYEFPRKQKFSIWSLDFIISSLMFRTMWST